MNAIDDCIITNSFDGKANPTGGIVNGTGLYIAWQHGPLGRGVRRKQPNGAFVETVIAAAIKRLEFYQLSRFACDDNEEAIIFLRRALCVLEMRTADRERRGVEGEHKV